MTSPSGSSRPDFSAAARVGTDINETSTIAPGTSQRNGKVWECRRELRAGLGEDG